MFYKGRISRPSWTYTLLFLGYLKKINNYSSGGSCCFSFSCFLIFDCLFPSWLTICFLFCMAVMKLSWHLIRKNTLLMDLSITTCLIPYCTAYLFFIFIGGCSCIGCLWSKSKLEVSWVTMFVQVVLAGFLYYIFFFLLKNAWPKFYFCSSISVVSILCTFQNVEQNYNHGSP